MHAERTEHTYEVWATTAVGPMCTLESTDEAKAIAELRYARAARVANGFGGQVWIKRDGEVFEPDA